MDVNLIVGKVLLSKICPTSPESDQTEGGGSVGCTQRTPRQHRGSVPESESRERKIRSEEDTALIQIESKRICQENS